jgi:glucokinase
MAELFLGIDLGGTNVKCGVVDQDGNICGRSSVSTGIGPDDVIANMVRGARQAVANAAVSLDAIRAVGVISPGPLSTTQGIVFKPANLPGFVSVPLRARIAVALNKPAVLENDANAAAYGEYWAGVGRGGKISDLAMLTLGTGVGGGLIHDSHVIHGDKDFAAELGHWIMQPDGEPCGCGQRGCLEVYSSASRTGQRATNLLKISQTPSTLRPVLQANGEVSAEDVAKHAAGGDALALEVWDITCKYLGLACVNIVHAVDPQMIVLAGGMSKAGDFLVRNVRKHFEAYYWNLLPPTVRIELAALGNDAGMVGAAGVAAQAFAEQAIPEIGR